MGLFRDIFFRNSELKKRREQFELEQRLKELKFKIENPPKYVEGEILADGTVICRVEKITLPGNTCSTIAGENIGTSFSGWIWVYKGVKDGKIISLPANSHDPINPTSSPQ